MSETIVEQLNTLYAHDPGAIHCLFSNHIPCNDHLAHDPHVQVRLGASGVTSVSALGILNGILSNLGNKMIVMKFEPMDENDSTMGMRFIGFGLVDDDCLKSIG